MLPASVDDVVSIKGASPVTVTDSCTVDGFICAFTETVCPTNAANSWATVAKPGSSIVILYSPTRNGTR